MEAFEIFSPNKLVRDVTYWHVAHTVEDMLCSLCEKMLGNSPHNVDLSPFDFHVLRPLKKVLTGCRIGLHENTKGHGDAVVSAAAQAVLYQQVQYLPQWPWGISGVHLNKPHMKMLTYRRNFMQLRHTRKQLDAVHTIIHYFFKIQFNIILLFMYALHVHN